MYNHVYSCIPMYTHVYHCIPHPLLEALEQLVILNQLYCIMTQFLTLETTTCQL